MSLSVLPHARQAKISACALLFVLLALPAAAQQAPATDVFLVDLSETEGELSPGTPRNLTARAGYDNQPSFTPDGRALLYTSQREGQTDIYRYDLATEEEPAQLTRTATSEYSPTVMPGGEAFSVVRVEADSTQRLWAFDLAGTDPGLVLPEVRPVGYHAWGDSATVALFVLGEPDSLWIANPRTQEAQAVLGGIGRSLHRRPGTQMISFVHKTGPEEWWIKQIDPETMAVEPLVRTRDGREDYCWTPGGTMLMGDGSTLWAWTPGHDGAWRKIADFAETGISGITRCAVSPDGRRLAFVAEARP